MRTSRRQFLEYSLATGALVATRASAQDAKPASKPLSILILGGTGFLGPATVEAAKARGHTLTLFNRGKRNPKLFPEIEQVRGDRDPDKDEGVKALADRKWDVVFDNSGYFPRHVKASAELLSPNIGQYVFISSISAYAKNDVEGADETAELATMEDPTIEDFGPQFQHYGPLKVLCEKAAEAACPGRATIVRPGYIVGPGDTSGRFAYWPVRFDEGGEVLVPVDPGDPIQVIDVRDLGEWLVHLAENRTFGTFNACGPAEKLSWGKVIEACKAASSADKVSARWATQAALAPHLKEQDGFPIWIAPAGESKGFHTWSNARAVKAGLHFRSIDATAKDTLAWFKEQPEDKRARIRGGVPREREAELLAALSGETKPADGSKG